VLHMSIEVTAKPALESNEMEKHLKWAVSTSDDSPTRKKIREGTENLFLNLKKWVQNMFLLLPRIFSFLFNTSCNFRFNCRCLVTLPFT
jgi:hypothetical protein